MTQSSTPAHEQATRPLLLPCTILSQSLSGEHALQFLSIFSQTSFLAHLRNFLKWNFFLCDLLFIKLVNEVTIDFFLVF